MGLQQQEKKKAIPPGGQPLAIGTDGCWKSPKGLLDRAAQETHPVPSPQAALGMLTPHCSGSLDYDMHMSKC